MNLGYTYAGMQSGSECYCGDNYGLYRDINILNETVSCNTTCVNNSKQICGGPLANLVQMANFKNCENNVCYSKPCGLGQKCIPSANGSYTCSCK
jgi:hypothetical protein